MNYSMFIFILVSVAAFYDASDHDRDVLNAYLEKFSKAVESKNLDAIRDLFTGSFSLEDCKRKYNQSQVIEKLMSLPSNNKIVFNIKGIRSSLEDIVFNATVTGLGAAPMEVSFDLFAYRGIGNTTPPQLTWGEVNNCNTCILIS